MDAFSMENISTVKNQSSSWVNGAKSSSIQWQFILMPNTTGELTIPSLYIADLKSKKINIQVVEESDAAHADEMPRLAFIEKIITTNTPVVQSQVTLNIKLHHAPSLAEGTLTDPIVKDAIVLPLGEEKRYKD